MPQKNPLLLLVKSLPGKAFGLCTAAQRRTLFKCSLVFCLLLLLNAFQQLHAQNAIVVKGKVLDKNSGEPVFGASVTVRGSNRGVSTREDGTFSINVPSVNTSLVISSVGYEKQEVKITNAADELVVSINPSGGELSDVVVTALGIQRTAKSLTYATQKVSGDQLNEVRDANIANTLSGKVAGLTVTSTANGPGGATRIILRGNRSIQGDNNALIVVDGVPIDNSTPAGQVREDAGSSNTAQSGSDGISSINPDDIESISIMKGAAGAALYGSRANNGVIIITTKRGKPGKIAVNVNSGISIENPMTLQKWQDQYSQGAGGEYSTRSSINFGEKISGQQVMDFHGNAVTLKAYPNNIKDFFSTGLSVNNAVGITTGSDKIQAYVSYANNYINGIVPTNTLRRNSFNARLGINITDRFSVDAKLTYVLQDILNKPGVGGDGLIAANLYRTPVSVNLEEYKDYKTIAGGVEKPYYWVSSDPVYTNPYWTIYNTHHNENRSRVTGLVALKYKLTDWLNIQARVSNDSYNDFITQSYANNTPNYARKVGGYYSEENDYIAERNVDVLINGTNKIAGGLKLTYNIGASDVVRSLRTRRNIADGLNITNKYDLLFGTTLTALTSKQNREMQSVYGTAQFSYNDYLYLDLTARNDWSSTLPSPYSFFYPSIGANAILSEMMKMPDWINLLKIRASYSKVGNDATPYLINQTYNYIAGNYGGYVASNTIKSISNLKPELTTSIEAGTEWRLFNNRLSFDFTYYKTNSKNQLLKIQMPTSSGFANTYINAGNIQNAGIELMLAYKLVQSKNFTWDMGLNYALNKSKIIELVPPDAPIYLSSNQNGRVASPVVKQGGEFGDLWGYKWQRQDGQFVVSDNGLPIKGAKIERLGNYNPKYTIGFSNTFKYRNWVLGVLVDGKFGGVVASGTASQLAYAGASEVTLKHRTDTWTLPAVHADKSTNTTAINAEQFWQIVAQGDYGWGEFFTYDATNVRLRELSLGYEFTKLPRFLKAAKFSFVARNVFFIYRGSSILDIPGIGKRKLDFDPEVSFGNSSYQGIEYYNLPSTRSLGVNLKLSF
ncbi:MAG: SusC/RagA family TonB-linked outer membrane protein [Chitinophagaceae bacterium]|nr:SusC/RagA family TonB-linked outer membrane protein [Chitinophagaceae bacterium]